MPISNNRVNMTLQNTERHDPYAALRYRDFQLLLTGRFITSFGNEMLSFAIGWELVAAHPPAFCPRHGRPGAGHPGHPAFPASGTCGGPIQPETNCDHLRALPGALCAGPWVAFLYRGANLYWIYALLLGVGISRAFNDPASSTLLPQTVPPPLFSNAATWNTSTWQFASITGPAAGRPADRFFQFCDLYLHLRRPGRPQSFASCCS